MTTIKKLFTNNQQAIEYVDDPANKVLVVVSLITIHNMTELTYKSNDPILIKIYLEKMERRESYQLQKDFEVIPQCQPTLSGTTFDTLAEAVSVCLT